MMWFYEFAYECIWRCSTCIPEYIIEDGVGEVYRVSTPIVIGVTEKDVITIMMQSKEKKTNKNREEYRGCIQPHNILYMVLL